MNIKHHFNILAFFTFLFVSFGVLTACGTPSEEPSLDLSESQPSLLLFYTEN